MHPALTSLDINANQLGMEAVSQLIKHIETPGMFATRTIVPFTITKRDSCKDLTKL
jgi:DNA-binding LacI/PurR family transcriptional regulator